MRVIAGELKGRIFSSPRSRRTHPMSDKMRGALFNVLGDISGLSMLDGFTGTGAIAIEACSRGANHIVAVERDKKAFHQLQANIEKLGLAERIHAVRANVVSWSNNNQGRRFDIIIADPPYDDLQAEKLHKLVKHLAGDGTFVVSWPVSEVPEDFNNLRLVTSNTHAGGRLLFYKFKSRRP